MLKQLLSKVFGEQKVEDLRVTVVAVITGAVIIAGEVYDLIFGQTLNLTAGDSTFVTDGSFSLNTVVAALGLMGVGWLAAGQKK